jgi:hypothetical protein
MTTIAWDGRTLAADKLATSPGNRGQTPIFLPALKDGVSRGGTNEN